MADTSSSVLTIPISQASYVCSAAFRRRRRGPAPPLHLRRWREGLASPSSPTPFPLAAAASSQRPAPPLSRRCCRPFLALAAHKIPVSEVPESALEIL
jgi:hypothetical protein